MGREPRPHAVERLGHLGDAAEPLGQIVLLLLARAVLAGVDAATREPGPVVVGQSPHHLGFDEAPPCVVRARPAPGQGDDLLGGRGMQAQDPRPERHLDVMAQRALPRPHRSGQHLDHAHVALELRHRRVVDPAHAHLGDQSRHGRKADPGLPKRREHLLDVAQEQRIGPDHEHALALEWEAVGVEEIGGAVQGHGRLARARTTLDDQDAGERRADDLVLLALNGPDDVAHVPGAGLAECGEQRTRSPQHHPVGEQALALRPGWCRRPHRRSP